MILQHINLDPRSTFEAATPRTPHEPCARQSKAAQQTQTMPGLVVEQVGGKGKPSWAVFDPEAPQLGTVSNLGRWQVPQTFSV